MKLQSQYALLDVMHGRKNLLKLVEANPNSVEVTIKGTVDCVFGNDDGVSREFSIRVTSVKAKQATS